MPRGGGGATDTSRGLACAAGTPPQTSYMHAFVAITSLEGVTIHNTTDPCSLCLTCNTFQRKYSASAYTILYPLQPQHVGTSPNKVGMSLNYESCVGLYRFVWRGTDRRTVVSRVTSAQPFRPVLARNVTLITPGICSPSNACAPGRTCLAQCDSRARFVGLWALHNASEHMMQMRACGRFQWHRLDNGRLWATILELSLRDARPSGSWGGGRPGLVGCLFEEGCPELKPKPETPTMTVCSCHAPW